MTFDRLEIKYSVYFESPFHCGSGMGGGLVDRLTRRDEEDFLIIPGSTIKGVVRENIEHLARIYGMEVASPHLTGREIIEHIFQEHNLIYLLFGSPHQQGCLYFDDATLTEYWHDYFAGDEEGQKRLLWQVENRTRVRMSRLTGTSASQALFTTEFGVGGLTFKGRVTGNIPCTTYQGGNDAEYARLLLLVGLMLVDGLGSGRSTGAGRCRLEITGMDLNGKPLNVSDELNRIEDLELLEIYD